jgi:hypothetical protein
MNTIIHLQKAGAPDFEALEITDEIFIADLLRQAIGAEEVQFDLFPELRAEPYNRQHRASEAGIKSGERLVCRPKRHEVRVHIDEEVHSSGNVTTGQALYDLGHVAAGRQLYREVEGNREDTPIFRDGEVFELKQDEHFHSSDHVFKGYDIFVNTLPKIVPRRLVTFNEIVHLAFKDLPAGTDQEFTVVYRNAAGRHPQGTLAPQHAVKVQNGTIFDVTPTNRS